MMTRDKFLYVESYCNMRWEFDYNALTLITYSLKKYGAFLFTIGIGIYYTGRANIIAKVATLLVFAD